MLLPVILAGGSGSRLWPLSRTLHPKQFIKLTSSETMLQETVKRLDGIAHKPPFIICNEEHRFIVAEQLRQKSQLNSGIVLEPVGRNTAPAIALAAFHAIKNKEDPLLLVLAADHQIKNQEYFVEAVLQAEKQANKGKLVTFGVVPSSPETGYGYIKKGKSLDDFSFAVERFVEKPSLEIAKQYLDSKEFLWNSGMFLFKASRYLEELEKHRPDIFEACKIAYQDSRRDLDFIRLNEKVFKACPDESIDYAVMEHTNDATVVPLDAGWSDVGSFSSLWEVADKDDCGNVIRGDVVMENTRDSFVYSQSKLVSTVGIEELVIVETKDALLVAHKDNVQDVKNIVSKLKAAGRNEWEQHREVFRPWGSHDEIARGDNFNVKHVVVKPGEATATQMHYHRSEHWVVVQGTAKVINGDKSFILAEDESTYVAIGSAHKIENPGKVDLHLIEVRTGNYLEEDDIVRLEEYGVGY